MTRTFNITRLRKLADTGMSQKDIARVMGYSPNTVCYHAKKNGIGNQGKRRR